jgi:hypothetical protein
LAFAIACNGGSAVFINVPCAVIQTSTSTANPNTTTGSTTTGSTTTASKQGPQQFKASYGYPYDLTEAGLNPITSGSLTCPSGQVPKLEQSTITTSTYNIVSSAQFFVFVGVMSFLYSIAFTIIYVFLRHKYNNIVFIPLIVSKILKNFMFPRNFKTD